MIEISKLECPKCERYTVLNDDIALEVAKKRLKILKIPFEHSIENIDKNELLKFIFEKRGEYFEFFNSSYTLDINDALSKQHLLKTIMKLEMKNKRKLDENSCNEILNMFKIFIEQKRIYNDIKEGLMKMLYFKKYNEYSVSESHLLRDFEPIPTEEYIIIKNYYKKYDLLTKGEDDELMKQYKKEINEIKTQLKPNKGVTPKERIKNAYGFINTLDIGLHLNSMFQDVFNFKNYKDIIDDPNEFTEFIFSTFKKTNKCSETKFISNAKNTFKKNAKILRQILLFEESNLDTFPLFVKIIHDGKSWIYTDTNLCLIVFFLLHTIILKNEYDQETARRGMEFEKIPKKIFKKNGFDYFENHKVKNKIEIDGIAIKDNYCFVIEIKGKKVPNLTLEKKIRETLIRDAKGIVDGWEYTGEKKKKKRSMIERVQYVKNNSEKFRIKNKNKMNFHGIVVTRFYQGIPKHNKIKFVTDDELEKNLSENNLSFLICD